MATPTCTTDFAMVSAPCFLNPNTLYIVVLSFSILTIIICMPIMVGSAYALVSRRLRKASTRRSRSRRRGLGRLASGCFTAFWIIVFSALRASSPLTRTVGNDIAITIIYDMVFLGMKCELAFSLAQRAFRTFQLVHVEEEDRKRWELARLYILFLSLGFISWVVEVICITLMLVHPKWDRGVLTRCLWGVSTCSDAVQLLLSLYFTTWIAQIFKEIPANNNNASVDDARVRLVTLHRQANRRSRIRLTLALILLGTLIPLIAGVVDYSWSFIWINIQFIVVVNTVRLVLTYLRSTSTTGNESKKWWIKDIESGGANIRMSPKRTQREGADVIVAKELQSTSDNIKVVGIAGIVEEQSMPYCFAVSNVEGAVQS